MPALLLAGVFLLAAGPSAGAPEQYDAPGITLAELVQRNDAAEGDLQKGTYHIVRQATDDGDVETRETYSTPQGYRTTDTVAGITSAWGASGGRSWIQEPNGFVHLRSDATEHDPLAIARDNPTAPSSGATLLGIATGTDPEYVVQLEPSPGLRELRYYDVKTYLLSRVATTGYDGHTHTTQYADYRSVFGETTAFEQKSWSDYSTQIRTQRIVAFEKAPDEPQRLAVPPSTTPFDLGGRDSIEIPADFTIEGIIVRMNVGSRGLDLLLDSGASTIALSDEVVRELGLTTHAAETRSMGGLFRTSLTRLSDVSIGPLRARSAVVTALPFDYQIDDTSRAVGLLGCDFFASGAVQVDFRKRRLVVYAKTPPNLIAEGWSKLPISVDECVPMAKATFSGRPGRFILDLGAYTNILYRHYFDAFDLPTKGVEDTLAAGFVGGEYVGLKQFRFRQLLLADLAIGGALIATPSTLHVQERDYDGLLGRQLLADFDLIFDYAGGAVYLKPFDD
ncbi:MAG TPA: aspartyl protease family protein [Verrucomicrobiae bacterium]|nr:aspartyl protease family protein [Verrucomicrobiae bacterium]